MLVIVQTYPAHFYQTLLCLRSISEILHPAPEVLLIVDDRSSLCWPNYVQDCRTTYDPWITDILLSSKIPCLRLLDRSPWIRQQTMKLLLDTVVDRDQWLFIDGDVVLTAVPPLDKIPFSCAEYQGVPLEQRDPMPGEMSSQVLFYVRYMLGIDWAGFLHPKNSHCMITASHPPVHVMRRDVLWDLRSYVEDRFHCQLAVIHQNIINDARMAACEWDLIECFRQEIMNEPARWFNENEFCRTTWNSDREQGQQWFQDQELPIDPHIWSILPDKKYF